MATCTTKSSFDFGLVNIRLVSHIMIGVRLTSENFPQRDYSSIFLVLLFLRPNGVTPDNHFPRPR